MEDVANIISFIKNYVVSNELFMALVLLVAVYLSLRLVFPQFRLIKATFNALKDTGDKGQGISSFASFMTALGSRIGVGNVAGIATAICLGGPGAIFWVWMFGIFGSAIAIVEGILGQAFKETKADEYFGGPAYYISKGIKNGFVSKYISKAYAVIAVVAFGIMMNGIQCNTVVSSVVNGFHTEKTITIIVTAILVALIIWGGIKRISKFESILTPIKCFVYLGFAITVIVYYNEYIGLVFKTIFESALGFNSIFGGMLGSAISMGVRRGIFSTDVCYGPGGIFAASARTDHPVKQGLLQGFSVLLSTLLICTATALVILLSGSFDVVGFTGDVLYQAVDFSGQAPGVEWVQHALDGVPFFTGWASGVLAAIIAIFACGTIIGFYYCMESNLRFLVKNPSKTLINVFKVIFVAALIVSSALDSGFVWDITDIGSGLLAWINLLCIIALSPIAVKIMKSFTASWRAKEKPQFNPAEFGIKDESSAWK